MVQRNRAWRRRKARNVIAKVKATKEWLLRPFDAAKPKEKPRPHAAQKLRAQWSLDQQMREA